MLTVLRASASGHLFYWLLPSTCWDFNFRKNKRNPWRNQHEKYRAQFLPHQISLQMQGHKKGVRAAKVLDFILLLGRFICWYMQGIEKFVYQRLPSKGQCKSEEKFKLTRTSREEVAFAIYLFTGCQLAQIIPLTWGHFPAHLSFPCSSSHSEQVTREGEIRVFPIIRRNQRG